MTEEDMDVLLKSYKPDLVPSFEQVRVKDKPNDFIFDGAFGWSI